MPQTIFVVGPTAVGKSTVALALAEETGAEIVNADAFQVYDGLDLLTAKPGVEERRRVPHHLYGTVPLTVAYNAALHADEANHVLREIHKRGRPAIVVGGTGLYVKALTHGLSPLPASNAALRTELEQLSLDELVQRLATRDPVAMQQIDSKNLRRVIRALEVCVVTGKPFSSFRDAWDRSPYEPGQAGIFLDREREDLRARIDQRVEEMFDAGVVEEVRAVAPGAVGSTAMGTIGLMEIQEMLAEKFSLNECKSRIKTRTNQYAKRQLTWFKRETIFRRVLMPPH